jgi:putative NADH-flavin reductase
MKIVVFGASGRTGIPLVKQALAAGYQVVALVRTLAKLPIQDSKLTVIQGDVTNAADVERAIQADCDAVFTALAPAKNADAPMLALAAQNILNAMQKANVRRLIWMTGAGVPAPEDQPKLINHLIKLALRLAAGPVLAKSEEAVNRVRRSDRDWVVVRAPMLVDGEATGKLRVGWVGVDTGPRLVRADGAAFMLSQLTNDSYLRRAPMISN